jgi:hypothetical protein
MIPLLLGAILLAGLMWALGMFSRAQVTTLKQLGVWVLAIGGLLLSVLLVFRSPVSAVGVLVMLGPLVWSWLGVSRKGPAGGTGNAGQRPSPRAGPMTRAEAYEVLGLKPGATEEEIRAAHRRLMQAAHPDHGGSDWLAARVNLARDVLLS